MNTTCPIWLMCCGRITIFLLILLPVSAFGSNGVNTGPDTLIGNEESIEYDNNSRPEYEIANDTVPDPSYVLRRSMIVPGWGQVINEQTWKVPVIYGIFAGLAYYSIVMDQSYRDYRAAFYNSRNPDGDQRFGPTPDYIDPTANPESLRYSRNQFRNRRDLTFIGMVLAYGLNLVDAYVFAHMRDFDVSDDLSARIHFGTIPENTMAEYPTPGQVPFGVNNMPGSVSLTLSLQLP